MSGNLIQPRPRNLILNRIISLLFVALSCAFLGILINVYFHELGHYYAAKYFELEPSIHFTSLDNDSKSVFSIIFSDNFKAYVSFNQTENVFSDLIITFAGPLVNLLISLFVGFIYFVILAKIKQNADIYKKHFWNLMLADTILISLLIPSVISFVVNMSFVSGSDGKVIYDILFKTFFK